AGAWGQLKSTVLPALLASRPAGVLRAWVPGCSTGEEAYSLAMVFKEAMEPFAATKNTTLQIFATDLDREAIEKARHGLFLANIAADVSPQRLRRFLLNDERGYRIREVHRHKDGVAPPKHNIDSPYTQLGLLS